MTMCYTFPVEQPPRFLFPNALKLLNTTQKIPYNIVLKLRHSFVLILLFKAK